MIPQKYKPKFFVNIFPSTEFDWDCIKIDDERKFIYVRHLFEFHSSFDVKVVPKFWCFKTDGVFMNCCQSDVYATVMKEVVDKVFLGIDNVMMSYGQNFSGKTFALSGFNNQFELRGIVPRFLTDLFQQKKAVENEVSTQIWISSVDIYGDSIYDLHSKTTKLYQRPKETKKVKVKSEWHCLELLLQAEGKRMKIDRKTYNAHTASNIITFTVEMVSLVSNVPNDKISMVHFVDLAGVDTIDKNLLTSFKDPSNQGCANVTKTLLEIFALKCKDTDGKSGNLQVNKRLHKLTQYLDKSISPVSNLIAMCHIRPNHEDLTITLSLLKFGMIIQRIPIRKPEHKLKPNHEMTIKSLQDEIESLKDELILRNLWGERCPMTISQDRVEFVKRSVNSFLKGDITEIELLSVVDDCSLILNFIKTVGKEVLAAEKTSSVASQTEEPDNMSWSTEKEGGEKRRKSNLRGSIVKEKASSIASKHVSIEEKPKETSKAGTTGKAKSGKTGSDKTTKGVKASKKVPEKPVSVSEEVQVNLSEPKCKMPIIGSREDLWAQFVVSRPEIQIFLDKLSLAVNEKIKFLNSESLKFDEIKHCLIEKQMTLNKIAGFRHIDCNDNYDKDGRVVVSEEESNLVKEINQTKKSLEIQQQTLIQAQVDWLDALEKMNCEKAIIDEDFKQFCVSNELFALNQDKTLNYDLSGNSLSKGLICEPIESQNEDIPTLYVTNTMPNEDELIPFETPSLNKEKCLEKYTILQKKYLGTTLHY